MQSDYLKIFAENISRFNLQDNSRTNLGFNEQDIERAITILSDFFGPDYFKLQKSNSNNYEMDLNANNIWIIYHLAQTENSLGSILVLLEIAVIINYFSSSESGRQLLYRKLKPSGKVNERELRSSLFELYVAMILKRPGLDVSIDIEDASGGINKRLDMVVNFENEKYLVECMTFMEHEEESYINSIGSLFTLSYYNLIKKHQSKIEVLKRLPVCGYMFAETKKDIRIAKKTFKESLETYQKRIITSAGRNETVDSSYEIIVETKCKVCIEPFRVGLFESYNGFLNNKFLGVKFRLTPRMFAGHPQLAPQVDMSLKFPNNEIEERIKIGIEGKRSQHHVSVIKNKLFIFEYENYQGIRIRFDRGPININRLRGNLSDNQIALIIHKDSTSKGNIVRNKIMFSKNEDSRFFKRLESLQLGSFVELI